MFKFFTKTHKKETKNQLSKTELKLKFFSHTEHQWIIQSNFIRRNFDMFLDILPQNVLNFVVSEEVLFVKTNGKYAFSVAPKSHVIVIFPEIYQALNSFNFDRGFMIIAHELGHIISGHSKVNVDPLEAQVEADRFAIQLGYERELEMFLEEQPESIEKRTRLAYLTSYVFSKMA